MKNTPWHMCVLIPARNEEDLLPACLESVRKACLALPPSVSFDVIVAVDSSTDRTWEMARRGVRNFGVVIQTDDGTVGEVRALATELALKRYPGPRDRCWLANTDADSTVPPNWLTVQLALATNGIEAMAGTIDVVNFEEHDTFVEERFRRTYPIAPDGSHVHVHGANIGVRADWYVKAGGWRNLATREDHDLWGRLSSAGAKKVSINQARVITSGRRVGRAPHGFAQALAAHNETVA